jgi:hypothetical protein
LTQAGPKVQGAGVGQGGGGEFRAVGWAAGACWLPDGPLLSAGEAFLGSFVAGGMGPAASSHGSPVPLPSDLSFRSPTPSNLPMVQLWAAHAHEGKERAGRAGPGRCPQHSPACPLPFAPPSPLHAVCGLRGPALSLRPPLCASSAQRQLRLPQGLHTCCSLAAPHPSSRAWLTSPRAFSYSLVTTHFICVLFHEIPVFPAGRAPRAGPSLFRSPPSPWRVARQ